jgi:hypothetical protein
MNSSEFLVGVVRLIIVAVVLVAMGAVRPKRGPFSRW